MSNPIKIDVWSDVACPFCYLGKRRLEMALDAFGKQPDSPDVEIEYHSFELQPDMPAEFEGDHASYIRDRMGWSLEQVEASSRQIEQQAAQVGLDYHTSQIRMTNTILAHQLLHYAKAHGQQAEMKERLLKAYFTEGRHVGRIAELADLAAEIGLDREDVVRSLTASEYRAAVEADKQQAANYRISGVPFYVIDNKYGVSGAQQPATFLVALSKVAEERTGA